MLPLLEVAGQLHGGGLQLLSGVLLKDGFPSLNVACAGSRRSTSGAGLQVNRRKDVQRDVAAGQLRTRDADRATGIWVLARYPLTLCPSG